MTVFAMANAKEISFRMWLSRFVVSSLLALSLHGATASAGMGTKEERIENHDIRVMARNYAIASGLVLLLAGAGVFVAYSKQKEAMQRQRELEYKASLSDIEMKVLRLQMNPHFIFNSLNSIGDYISKNDITAADYYLAKFAKLMRGILENSEEQEIQLSDELKMLERYMQLESARLAGKFTYEIAIEEGVNVQDVMVPPLILQPFVENSIWHGIANKEGGGKIVIEVSKTNRMVRCAIEDDGIGRKAATRSGNALRNHRSYGVKITKDRIAMLNKLKGVNAKVQVIDLEYGTRVEIDLPWAVYEEEAKRHQLI